MTEKEKEQLKTALAVMSGEYDGCIGLAGDSFGFKLGWREEAIRAHATEIVYELILRALGESDL